MYTTGIVAVTPTGSIMIQAYWSPPQSLMMMMSHMLTTPMRGAGGRYSSRGDGDDQDNGGDDVGTEHLIAEFEFLEVAGAFANIPLNAVGSACAAAATHMAALLYLNDPVSARHLWKRIHRGDYKSYDHDGIGQIVIGAVEPWWNVAKDMLDGNLKAAFAKLKELNKEPYEPNNQVHVPPAYAREVIYSLRKHLLRGWIGSSNKDLVLPDYASDVLLFSKWDEDDAYDNDDDLVEFESPVSRVNRTMMMEKQEDIVTFIWEERELLQKKRQNRRRRGAGGTGNTIQTTDVVSFLGSK